MKNRNLPLLVLLLGAVILAIGIVELFKLRFEAGDVYPPYSTLRADPLGASAFYESLEKVPDISVSRDFRPTDQMPEGRGIAYLHLAGDPEEWQELPEQFFKDIESFVKAGGRLVIAFFPEPAKPFASRFARHIEEEEKKENTGPKDKDHQKPKAKSGKPSKRKKQLNGEDDQLYHWVSLSERWGIGFDVKNLKSGENDAYIPLTVENTNEPSLPEAFSWHSGVVMTNLDDAWRVIYARGPDAVLAERRFGHGTIVFSTDSYFLSNEAMQKDRQAELLAWVIGPCRQVMFDEAHLGIVQDPGIATLLRKYQLHGLVAGLLLLAGLFIWKNMAGFGPAREVEMAGSFVAGKDSASGFVNLLRRHIKPRDLLGTCVAEWKKSQPKGKFSSMRIQRVEAFMQAESAKPPRDRNAVQEFQTICTVLKKGPEPPLSNPESQVSTQKI